MLSMLMRIRCDEHDDVLDHVIGAMDGNLAFYVISRINRDDYGGRLKNSRAEEICEASAAMDPLVGARWLSGIALCTTHEDKAFVFNEYARRMPHSTPICRRW